MNLILIFAGPLVAAVGIGAVFFVMRHKSVQTRSMYSSRRLNLERKVRAARTRTLGPEKHVEAPKAAHGAEAAPPKLTYEPSAFAGPPVAPPAAPMAAPNQTWDVGPTAAPPSPPEAAPPPAPTYAPAPQPAPPPAAEPVWNPAAAQPSAPAAVPAGAGASWSIVGAESKDVSISEGDGKKKKKKKGKADPQAAAWSLASGEQPGDESADEVKTPSAALAIAQYAVLVVGLVMVLIGVLVMVANSHVT